MRSEGADASVASAFAQGIGSLRAATPSGKRLGESSAAPKRRKEAPFPRPLAAAGQDLNLRPPGYEPEVPGTPRLPGARSDEDARAPRRLRRQRMRPFFDPSL